MSNKRTHAFAEVRSGRCYLEPLCGRTRSVNQRAQSGKIITHRLPPLFGDVDYLRKLGFVMPHNKTILTAEAFVVDPAGGLFELSPAAKRRQTFLQKVVCEEHRRLYGTNDKICEAFRRKPASLEQTDTSSLSRVKKEVKRNMALKSEIIIGGLTDSKAYYQNFLAEKKRRQAMLEKVNFTRKENKRNFERQLRRSSELVAPDAPLQPPKESKKTQLKKPTSTPDELLVPQPRQQRTSSFDYTIDPSDGDGRWF